MAKPMLVTLPFVMLLLDYWPLKEDGSNESRLQRAGAQPVHPRRLVLEKWLFFLLAVAFVHRDCFSRSTAR